MYDRIITSSKKIVVGGDNVRYENSRYENQIYTCGDIVSGSYYCFISVVKKAGNFNFKKVQLNIPQEIK